MLENPTPSASPADPAATVKRYAPPNQRNRSLNRRKSGDRVDRTNSLNSNDGEKNQLAASRIVPVMDHGDAGRSNHLNENARPGLIALEGCSSTSSDASQFLYDRWQAAMHCYNNPSIDLSDVAWTWSLCVRSWIKICSYVSRLKASGRRLWKD